MHHFLKIIMHQLCALLLLLFSTAAATNIQGQTDCRFPPPASLDSAFQWVLLKKYKEQPDSAEMEKIRKKKISNKVKWTDADSVYRLARAFLFDKFGEEIVCKHIAFEPWTFGIGRNETSFRFKFYEKPYPDGRDFFSFQIYFGKKDGVLKIDYPDYLPDCRNMPDSCYFKIDKKAAGTIARNIGFLDSLGHLLSIYKADLWHPFHYKLTRPKANCMEDILLLDRRTGKTVPQPAKRRRGCVTFRELVESSPYIFEVENLKEKYSFYAGPDIVTTQAFRVLKVFKGDSIPPFIEVAGAGGSVGMESQHWSDSNFGIYLSGGRGLLFLQDFSNKYAGFNFTDSSFFRYRPFLKYGNEYDYRHHPSIALSRSENVEKHVFQEIEKIAGRPRQTLARPFFRKKELAKKMDNKGYGYLKNKEGIFLEIDDYIDDGDTAFVVFATSMQDFVYPVGLKINISFDTLALGKFPVRRGIVSLSNIIDKKLDELKTDSPEEVPFLVPENYDLHINDDSTGKYIVLHIARKKGRGAYLQLAPLDIPTLLAAFSVHFPGTLKTAFWLGIKEEYKNTGCRYIDLKTNKKAPFYYVATSEPFRMNSPLPLQVDNGGKDTLIIKGRNAQSWRLTGTALDDPDIKVFVPVAIDIGEDSLPLYQALPKNSILRKSPTELFLRFGNWTRLEKIGGQHVRLREGEVYMVRNKRKIKEKVRVGYLKKE